MTNFSYCTYRLKPGYLGTRYTAKQNRQTHAVSPQRRAAFRTLQNVSGLHCTGLGFRNHLAPQFRGHQRAEGITSRTVTASQRAGNHRQAGVGAARAVLVRVLEQQTQLAAIVQGNVVNMQETETVGLRRLQLPETGKRPMRKRTQRPFVMKITGKQTSTSESSIQLICSNPTCSLLFSSILFSSVRFLLKAKHLCKELACSH